MDIKKIKLRDGYLITKQGKDEAATKSGILVEENTDDFLVHAIVVNSASADYPVDCEVVYHVLDSESLRDGADSYSLVHENKIKGIYG